MSWVEEPQDGGATFGPYSVVLAHPDTRRPWLVRYNGFPMARAHGNFTGYQRFASVENAKRWVERRIARRSR